MSKYREEIFRTIGLTSWRVRLGGAAEDKFDPVLNQDASRVKVVEGVDSYTHCLFHGTRGDVVSSKGPGKAELLIVGETSGTEEDKQGLPFAVKPGLLLDEMLLSCGIRAEDVYIANVKKNETPRESEIGSFIEFLLQQVLAISPAVILALGETSASALLDSEEPLDKLRGKVHYDNIVGVPIVVTCHPAYLIRSPLEKVKIWGDLNLLKEMVEKERK